MKVGEKMNGAYVLSVDAGSIAEELEIEAGDKIFSINGREIIDYLDYKFLSTGEEILMTVEKKSGEIIEYEIENPYLEDLGINFPNMLFDKAHSCHNKCIFCFIDQMPKGMRDTLYFKDDDARLSFLYGNYVTLTNMNDADIDRLIEYRISPVNISVHSTNPELRKRMLNNKNAGKILEHIKKLYDNGIEMNMQVVLCKGINDGEELDRTIKELSEFLPVARSMSVVPVGLTRCREGLYPLEPFEKEDCIKVVKQIEGWQDKLLKERGTRFVYASDEFYVNGGIAIPDEENYEDFPQIENGVGMLASFEAEFNTALQSGMEKVKNEKIIVATGEISYNFIKKLVSCAKMRYNINDIDVVCVKNELFGGRVSVSGLLGASDLFRELAGMTADKLLITESMLKADEDIFLDDVTLEYAQTKLGMEIVPVKNDGGCFLAALLGY
jgi:putative radical SAM enzyme (TIGR03279 family)